MKTGLIIAIIAAPVIATGAAAQPIKAVVASMRDEPPAMATLKPPSDNPWK